MKLSVSTMAGIFLNVMLLGSLFFVGITLSNDVQWNPWLDSNCDGIIDITDISTVIAHYGTYGTPVNTTQILLELVEKVESMNNTIVELQNTVTYLNTTVVFLNETVTILNETKLGAPDYDSGWRGLGYGYNIINHNLNSSDLLVYLVGGVYSYDMHIHSIGGAVVDTNGTKMGAWWELAGLDYILVYREMDIDNTDWAVARVLIWKIPSP